jgi:anti-sigma regulatory factor (Ser/Thr protein kinase)
VAENFNQHEPQLRLEMASQARFLAAARAMIANVAQRLGFSEIQCGQISLAVDEALCNIINHGYGKKPDGRIWINVHDLPGDVPRPGPAGHQVRGIRHCGQCHARTAIRSYLR